MTPPAFPSSPEMQRADIRASIEFRGIIRGCADHQWLIADAIWDVQAGGRDDDRCRWVVTTEEWDRTSKSHRNGTGTRSGSVEPLRCRRVVAHDRWTGWRAQAPTTAGIAERIRHAYRDGDPARASTVLALEAWEEDSERENSASSDEETRAA